MERNACFEIINYDKHKELVALWNTWHKKTCFMSVGNLQTPEWKQLINYTKEHLLETAEFIYDYLSEVGGGWPIMCLFDSTFGNFIESGDYVDPNSKRVIELYKGLCVQIKTILNEDGIQ